ncbi:MAG TPA: chemotaxis protein CheB [Paraburkholderia sp.]|jgi:two-component system chemotaxis response regulator CheB|nr:chemotaxis protein CheB [Paraburkholderia sp.]
MSTPGDAALDTIVIGTSAGGFDALMTLAGGLPPYIPASLMVVLHVGAHPSSLPERLSAVGPLPAHHAANGERLLPGRIYVAPPDHHLLLNGNSTTEVIRGPKENYARPAIDPLFRSAALARGTRVIGVILTGMLDDGAAGLRAVHDCGGVTIVQDPETAHAPDMPRNAMRHTRPHHVLPLAEIGPWLVLLAGSPAGATRANAQDGLAAEYRSLALGATPEALVQIARPTTLTCPDCGGCLWQIHGSMPPRYRCHTGHAYSIESLRSAGGDALEYALGDALRALHEKKVLSEELAGYHKEFGDERSASRFEREADRAAIAAQEIEKLMRGEA